jgi:small ubiquitin-related modifier
VRKKKVMGSGNNNDGCGGVEGCREVEYLNVKVTDGREEVVFKIKSTTVLKRLMSAYCERAGKVAGSVRFLFDGERVQLSDTPERVGVNICFVYCNGVK